MTAILRLESRKLVRSSLVLTGLLGLLLAFVLAVFPGFADEAELIEEAFPPVLLGLLGIEEIHTIEGFVGGYVFSLIWLLFAGIYFAYASAGMIVEDVRTRRMDLTLSNPVSRESVLLQKVAALWVPLVALHVGLFAVLFVGIVVIGETLDPVTLAVAHLFIVPICWSVPGSASSSRSSSDASRAHRRPHWDSCSSAGWSTVFPR